MKKVLIIISVLLLAGIGYFTYDKWVKHANLTLWSFIPADAALVLEGEVAEDLNALKGYPVWELVKQGSGFARFREGLSFLDSINGDGGFQAVFQKAPVLISTHKVSSTDLDFLFVVELQNISQNTFANAALGRLQKQGYRFKTRNYNDFKISEISNQRQTLTYIFYKNFFLASFTPYLVEDAVRAVSEPDLPSFKEKFPQLLNAGSQGLLDSYINYREMGHLLGAFIQKDLDFSLVAGNYEAILDSSFMQLSGFTYSTPEGWLQTHTSQPATFDMAEIVPENTACMLHLTASDMQEWKAKHIAHLRKNAPKAAALQDSLRRLYDFNADQVFDLVDNEIGLVTLESPRAQDTQKLLLLEVKDIRESLDFFSKLTQRIAMARGDSVYTEPYSENEIRFLPITDFPFSLLGQVANGFAQCFYINHRNYLIFSNDLQELKDLITNIQNENTWGKSIEMNNFLSNANNAANVSLFVNIPRSWNAIMSALDPEWVPHFKANAQLYRSLSMAAFQFSHLDGRYFTNYTFAQPEIKKSSIPKTSPENEIRFASPLISKPFLLKTHAHREYDILLQDSTYTLYYLDPNQNAQWSEPVDGPIISDIFPIDYYRNGKLQYLFATPSSVFLIDRTGTAIPGYPKTLPKAAAIEHLNLIDYDRSRNYRIAITDADGNVFLADKDLKLLDGWNPRKFSRRAIKPLEHARLGRKDAMISIQENGVINVLNRRGAFESGFPFDVRQPLSGDYFLKPSNALSTATLTVITTGGELVEITLEGALVRRDQLIKARADARFWLVTDTGKESFILVRNEGNTYDVLDDTGNLLFTKDYLPDSDIIVQYYQFGAGKDLVIFIDRKNETLYIYDKSGNLVTGNPLNASNKVSLIYSAARKAFQVFTTWQENLENYTFSY